MFGGGISNEAKTIIQFLNDNLRSAKSISEYLNDYAKAVLTVESASGGLFGDVTLPSKQEVLQNAGQRFAAEKAAPKSQQSIFDQPAGETGQQDRQQPEGQASNARSNEENAEQELSKADQKEKASAGQSGKQATPDSTQPFAEAVSSEPDTEVYAKEKHTNFCVSPSIF